jgi:PAS domain S-box-containing protein
VYSTFLDITESRQAEAVRDMLMAAIEQSGEMVIITSPEGIIQYVNQAFEKVSGYTRQEVMGQNPRILKSGKQDEAFYHQLRATLSKGDTFQGRMVNKRKDGSFYTEDATISPVCNASGAIVNYVAVNRDITEQILLEAQFQQAQKMESVGRLAGGVAHDFNNMLTIIISYTQMLINQTTASDPIHNDLKQILKAAQRSNDITRQLLAFARKQTINPKYLDLNDAVESTLKMLRRLIGEDIDLSWNPESGLWPVMADPSQMDQVLANLCVNARDAIHGVGKITIETDNISFDNEYCAEHPGFVPGDFVLLAVSDDGCGMDNPTLERLFEPFFTTKDLGQGTGLGLATVYGIVKQNNGFINVYSEPEKGTTFRIYLPRHTGEAGENQPKESVEIQAGRGETVLIVEDEASILKLGKRILLELGYTVLAAATPGQAMETAKTHEGDIHLIITDVVMPEMNGRDLSRQIQNFYPDIKILFMSGYTADVIAHQGVLDGGVNFIQKPFSNKDMAAKIREVLDAPD